jgi:hypothetical protein
LRLTRAGYYWDDPLLPAIQVRERDGDDTGLLDQHGNSIRRAPRPIGFGRDAEWRKRPYIMDYPHE